MKIQFNKTKTSTIALILTLTIAATLLTLPFVNAQYDMEMNLPGDVEPYNVALHQSIDIDLNGAHPGGDMELWYTEPGSTTWKMFGSYNIPPDSDLDVYDFDFNMTGEYQLKWMLDGVSSNVGIVHVFPPGEVPMTVGELKPHIYVNPQPVGSVGQQMFIVYMLDFMPVPETDEEIAAGLRGAYYDITLIITKPDATTETLDMPRSDPVGGGYLLYTPTETGTYSVKANFPGNWRNSTTEHVATWYVPVESAVSTFEVQQEPIPGWPDAPVTNDYWMRPISGPSHSWSALAGNWLGSYANVYPQGADSGSATSSYGYGLAPESPHILWTRQLFPTGSIMDERFGADVYTLNHYQGVRFSPAIIVDGKIHYEPPYNAHYPGYRGIRSGWETLDLYTGEQLFLDYDVPCPEFGQIYVYHSGNQHGGFDYLWRTVDVTLPELVHLGRDASPTNITETPISTGRLWEMIDGFTLNNICYVANVSSGTQVYGKDGSILFYDVVGSGADRRLTVWNVSAIPTMLASSELGTYAWQWRPSGGSHGAVPHLNHIHDGSTGFSLNVSIPNVSGSIQCVREGQFVIGGTSGSNNEQGITEGNLWALSLERGKEGTLLWNTTFTPPYSIGSYRRVSFVGVFPEDEVIVFRDQTALKWWVYDMRTGQKLWETEPMAEQITYYGMQETVYNGMLIAGGSYAGVLHAWDIRTGEERWTYTAPGAGTETPYGNDLTRIGLVADGKIYTTTGEHSSSSPLYRGPGLKCIDAETGEEIWEILGWFAEFSPNIRIADGILIGWNMYDGQIYAFGRGLSGTTVTASPKYSTLGTKVVVEGTVTDQTPTGRRNINNNLEFTLKDTPAISDEDMQEWMQYKFMGQAYPEDAKGVEVVVTVLDPNNNVYEVGNTTSGVTGAFGLAFDPPVPGMYEITAEFEGSASYGPSSATTYIYVDEAPSPAQPIAPEEPTEEPTAPEEPTEEPTAPEEPTEPEPTEPAEAPLFSTTDLAIIAAVAVAAVIGIAAYWQLRKRK